ncbi:MAG: ankyrin repeat domain-containing protein [Zoogloeaceae bacterium]|jgi:hypothetical protein|nr:ankyrin repeat domain-containing protein [Zoogloeaceae bacterium]
MPWRILQIAPTRDEAEIRRAYARLLKTRQHENDADFFRNVRAAYECALEDVRWAAENQPGGGDDGTSIAPEIPASSAPPVLIEAAAPETSAEWQDTEISCVEKQAEQAFADLEGIERALDFSCLPHWRKTGRKIRQTLLKKYPDRAFQCPAVALTHWQRLRASDLLQSLDYREQISERLAAILANNWPHSRAIWLQARDFLNWHPPVFSDYSPYGQALHFLFDREREWQNPAQKNRALSHDQSIPRMWFFMMALMIVSGFLKITSHPTSSARGPGNPVFQQQGASEAAPLVATAMLQDEIKRGNAKEIRSWIKLFHSDQEKKDSAMLAYAVKSAMKAEHGKLDPARLSIMTILMEEGFSEKVPLAPDGDSALDMALRHKDDQLLKALLEGGLSPDAVSADGQAIIFEAIETGRLDLLALVCAHGANLNLRNAKGQTPLAVAACRKNKMIVDFLLAQGVETAGIDLSGKNCEPIDRMRLRRAR